MFWNVVLEIDGDKMDRSCEKWSIKKGQGGEEYRANSKMKED